MQAPGSCPYQYCWTPVKTLCLLATDGMWTQISVFDGEDLGRLGSKASDLCPFLERTSSRRAKTVSPATPLSTSVLSSFLPSCSMFWRAKRRKTRIASGGTLGMCRCCSLRKKTKEPQPDPSRILLIQPLKQKEIQKAGDNFWPSYVNGGKTGLTEMQSTVQWE